MAANTTTTRKIQAAFQRIDDTTLTWLAGVSALVGVVTIIATSFDSWLVLRYAQDVDIYRMGGLAYAQGDQLYNVNFQSWLDALPFTYPPFAAMLFSPFGTLDPRVCGLLLTLMSGVLAWWCSFIALRRSAVRRPLVISALIYPLVVFSLPVWSTFGYGQINLVLLALIMADMFARPKWLPAGVLTGIAAAVKLTPAVFIVYWLVKKQYRAAGGVAAGFVGATALTTLIRPSYTWTYYTDAMFSISGFVDPAFKMNASLNGMVLRAG